MLLLVNLPWNSCALNTNMFYLFVALKRGPTAVALAHFRQFHSHSPYLPRRCFFLNQPQFLSVQLLKEEMPLILEALGIQVVLGSMAMNILHRNGLYVFYNCAAASFASEPFLNAFYNFPALCSALICCAFYSLKFVCVAQWVHILIGTGHQHNVYLRIGVVEYGDASTKW